jgi:hypothetical protein
MADLVGTPPISPTGLLGLVPYKLPEGLHLLVGFRDDPCNPDNVQALIEQLRKWAETRMRALRGGW